MVIFPRAKINLGLRITAKRTDGYHDLQTIFYPIPLCDALEFVVPQGATGTDRLVTSGLPVNCNNDSNLIIKTLKKVRELKPVPLLSIHLHKAIPMGAGLGGGSSDAAFFLKALNRYFSLGFSTEELLDISLSIGSDCPFFIECIPAFAEGRGEKLAPVQPLIDGKFLILINPGISISTREAYSGVTPYISNSGPRDFFDMRIESWKDKMVNDFERTVFEKHPTIGWIKQRLYEIGAIYSSMSGSGSAVYGLFSDAPVIPDDLRKMVIWSGVI